jgi:hypothetical protein
MNALAEIETAVEALTLREQKALMAFLARRLNSAPKTRRGLKAAARPPLEGLPANLSIGTRERVRELIAARHAANR